MHDVLASGAYKSKMSFQRKDSFVSFFDLGTENQTYPESYVKHSPGNSFLWLPDLSDVPAPPSVNSGTARPQHPSLPPIHVRDLGTGLREACTGAGLGAGISR